jgi:hypothetical protein
MNPKNNLLLDRVLLMRNNTASKHYSDSLVRMGHRENGVSVKSNENIPHNKANKYLDSKLKIIGENNYYNLTPDNLKLLKLNITAFRKKYGETNTPFENYKARIKNVGSVKNYINSLKYNIINTPEQKANKIISHYYKYKFNGIPNQDRTRLVQYISKNKANPKSVQNYIAEINKAVPNKGIFRTSRDTRLLQFINSKVPPRTFTTKPGRFRSYYQ